MAKLREFQGIRFGPVGLLPQHAEPDGEYRSRTRGDLWRFDFCDSEFLKTPILKTTSILIKEPDDQYQVILETKDNERAKPSDLNNLYVRKNSNSAIASDRLR